MSIQTVPQPTPNSTPKPISSIPSSSLINLDSLTSTPIQEHFETVSKAEAKDTYEFTVGKNQNINLALHVNPGGGDHRAIPLIPRSSLIDLGSLTSTPIQKHFETVSKAEAKDIYEFTVGKNQNINLALHVNPGGGDPDHYEDRDAELRLFEDNGDHVLTQDDKLIDLSNNPFSGIIDDAINQKVVGGTYFAQVIRSPGPVGTVSYNLDLSASAGPSNLLPTEVDAIVPLHNTSRTFTGLVGDKDTADVYHFNVEGSQDLTVSLKGLSKDADIRLIEDIDSDRVVDPGEEVGISRHGGSAAESFTVFGAMGDYFVQVYQYTGDTSYELNLLAINVPK